MSLYVPNIGNDPVASKAEASSQVLIDAKSCKDANSVDQPDKDTIVILSINTASWEPHSHGLLNCGADVIAVQETRLSELGTQQQDKLLANQLHLGTLFGAGHLEPLAMNFLSLPARLVESPVPMALQFCPKRICLFCTLVPTPLQLEPCPKAHVGVLLLYR